MTRVARIAMATAFIAAVPTLAPAGGAKTQEAAGEPIRLSIGPQLFIDDYLIEESEHLRRTTHQPVKLPQPILAKAQSWHLQPLFFQKVIYRPKTGLFEMWYNVKNPGGAPHVCFAYAQSQDGIQWTRPNLGLVLVGDSHANNLIDAPTGHYGLFFVDEGEDFDDPDRRFKMAYYNGGLCVAFSADGKRFKPYSRNPVIPSNTSGVEPYQPGYENNVGDIIDGCWDPLRKRYLMGCKIEQGGYPGKPNHHAPGWRRTVGMTVSDDFIRWRKPRHVVLPDPDNGIEEFYGFQPLVLGDLYLGFLRVLRDDQPADVGGRVAGIGWTELLTSRDGQRWTRYQEVFLDRNRLPGSWDHAMAWVGDCVTVGEEDFIYYCGYSAGHKVGDRQNGLARLRKNGFVSRDAGTMEARLRTRPVVLAGSRITVNAHVIGHLRSRLLDLHGQPLAGFNWDDCRPIQGDSITHPLQWTGNLSDLGEQPVRLEFSLRRAELYGFDLLQ
jgi:hypothetical protein